MPRRTEWGPFNAEDAEVRDAEGAESSEWSGGLCVSAELTDLLMELVAIDSINPDLVPGGAGEGQIAAFVAEGLGAAGLDYDGLGRNLKDVFVLA